MRISDWSSDVCSSDLGVAPVRDAITSCRRVRMVRADWAAVVGGGGAFVIDTPANRCRSRALLPRAAAGYLLHRPVWRSARQIPSTSGAAIALEIGRAHV